MTSKLFAILNETTTSLDQLIVGQFQLIEGFYEENQIDLSQQRIARLRDTIDKERKKISQWRIIIHRRRDQEKYRKKN